MNTNIEDAVWELTSPVTGAPFGEAKTTPLDHLDEIIRTSRAAFGSAWISDSQLRFRVLEQWAQKIEAASERLEHLLVIETGKSLAEARFELQGSIAALRFCAGAATLVGGRAGQLTDGSVAHLERQPVGPVLFITPWNWPVLLLVRDLAPALAAGVTAVVKPSEHAPISTIEIVKLLEETQVPMGVVQVVLGGAEHGRRLIADDRIRGVAFTGSTAVGKEVYRTSASTMKRILLELGGKGVNVVFSDANLEEVVETCRRTAFITAGQMCMTTTRILVQDSFVNEVADAFRARVEEMKVASPFDPQSDMGPVFSPQRRDAVFGYVESAHEHGHVLLRGEAYDDGGGSYVTPTVVMDVDADSPLVQEEIFGPVVTIERFRDEEEAVQLANCTEYGLAAGVWTSDLNRAWALARSIDAGTVWVNGYMTSYPQMPSGGFKWSGIGRTRGIEGIEQFTELKHINWGQRP